MRLRLRNYLHQGDNALEAAQMLATVIYRKVTIGQETTQGPSLDRRNSEKKMSVQYAAPSSSSHSPALNLSSGLHYPKTLIQDARRDMMVTLRNLALIKLCSGLSQRAPIRPLSLHHRSIKRVAYQQLY